jgi:tRNA A-37 threonylcarbamoyl transferase component Bud32
LTRKPKVSGQRSGSSLVPPSPGAPSVNVFDASAHATHERVTMPTFELPPLPPAPSPRSFVFPPRHDACAQTGLRYQPYDTAILARWGPGGTLRDPKTTTQMRELRPVDVDGSDLQLPSTILAGAPSASGSFPKKGARPAPSDPDVAFTDRYHIDDLIGRGGMGEVRACRDRVVGREIAIKRMRVPDDRRLWRFVREARIQGQLEHPAVPPVYDLGIGADGEPYFTMKRVRGDSLAEVLRARRDDKSMSERRLLTLFSNVCLAVHFIHSRGVVHRDLKPANIMLGAYGEAYVLDWGLAKISGAEEERIAQDAQELGPTTLDGDVLGTPGYMAPEQLRGESARADHRADVYSLGAILFEIVTGEPLHAAQNVSEVLVSTLSADGVRPSVRRPDLDIALELDELCANATRLDPDKRIASAREMSDAIEAYLDGVRDAQRRRELARAHVDRAKRALEEAHGPEELEKRALAMREVTRALGLDPSDRDAIETLVTLFAKPPRTIPREAEEAFLDAKDRTYRGSGRSLILAYLAYLFYVPFPFILGVRSFAAFAVLAMGTLSCIAVTVYQLKSKRRIEDAKLHLIAGCTTAGIATVAFGPLVFVPLLALVTGVGYAGAFPRKWIFGVVISCLAFMVPVVLALSGVLPDTLSITGDAIVAGSWLMSFPPIPTAIFLLLSHAALFASTCWYVARTQRQHDDLQRTMHVQAWHWSQLVPSGSGLR